MMINNYVYLQPKCSVTASNKNECVSFTGNPCVETLKYTNIGSCLEGFIGKVRLRKAENGGEYFADVFKRHIGHNAENYSIKNEAGQILGEIDIFIRKYLPGSYDSFTYKDDPSHVFVDNLRNYSNPKSPYYRQGLEYMKDIGTRLLQIAQRRSDEAQCVGNIKLISKGESKDWYKNVIGMVEEFPLVQNNGFKFRFQINNPNAMILPPHSKEPLSRLQGGL